MWTPKLNLQNGPLYLQLVDAMAAAIENGELKVGDKLPPQRQLAWHLDINPSTVTKAFHEATKRHLIAGEVGRGTYILAKSSEAALFNLKQLSNAQSIDLSTHVPATNLLDTDLENFLLAKIRKPESLSKLLSYHSPVSLLRMQTACAKWLDILGYRINSSYCIPTASAQNALLISLLACSANKAGRTTILVDELTFPGIKAIAKQINIKLHGIEMDELGIIPESLELAIKTTHANVLVSDPTLQNPTATSMNEQRKQAFLAIIKKYDLLFIEEYVIGCLSGQKPVSDSIKKQSLIITSFAKAVAPGMRFAMIAGEHPIITQLLAESHATSWLLSPLMAEISCEWIENGTAKKRLEWQWAEVKRRFRLFKSIFPHGTLTTNSQLCSHVWLPTKASAELACEKLKSLGVETVPAATFAVGRRCPENIRVSLTAAATMQQLKIALSIIKEAKVLKTL